PVPLDGLPRKLAGQATAHFVAPRRRVQHQLPDAVRVARWARGRLRRRDASQVGGDRRPVPRIAVVRAVELIDDAIDLGHERTYSRSSAPGSSTSSLTRTSNPAAPLPPTNA